MMPVPLDAGQRRELSNLGADGKQRLGVRLCYCGSIPLLMYKVCRNRALNQTSALQ